MPITRATLLATLCVAAHGFSGGASRPNFLWIMADDLGYGEVGAYPAGSAHGRLATPNLDKFARGAMRFTDAYAGYTVCAPSRTTLMTGLHSGHFEANGLSGTSIDPTSKLELLPELLKRAGYATAAVGKIAPLTDPTAQGFDFFIGQVNQNLCDKTQVTHSHNMYPRAIDQGAATANVNLTLNWAVPADATAARRACMAHPERFNYTVDVTSEQAIAWLRAHAAAVGGSSLEDGALSHVLLAQPFFLYQSFTVPHAGGWGHAPGAPESGAPVPSDGQYAGHAAEWPEVEVDHAAVVTYLDGRVGAMLDALEALHVDESTLVVFATDNARRSPRPLASPAPLRPMRSRGRVARRGRACRSDCARGAAQGAHLEGGHSQLFFNSTGGLSGLAARVEGGRHKRSLFEGGMRSPTMVRWPAAVPAGATSPFRWAFWDVLPTFAELAGVTPPAGRDGVSIVPTLLGEPQPAKPYLYWTWPGADRGAAPLPAGWRAEQSTEGTLVFVHAASGTVQTRHPLAQTAAAAGADDGVAAAARSGFALVAAEWKAIVPHCAAAAPSAADLPSLQLYHLPSDWAETHDLAATDEGQAHAERLLALAMNASASCRCFQC